MDTYATITTRRSIRRYSDKPLSNEVLKELLTAAMSGPSTDNQQPWQFVVLNDRGKLNELASIEAYQATLSHAPLAIVVCCDTKLLKWNNFWVIDCAIATQNILLAAHSKGLGAVWLGCHLIEERSKPVREVLGLPEHILPFAMVPIGYPAEEIPTLERYKPKRAHYNHW